MGSESIFKLSLYGKTINDSDPIYPSPMPKNLQVDEVVRIGQGSLSAVDDEKNES